MLEIGIIGTGVGIRTYYPALSTLPGVRVRGIVGRTSKRTQEVAGRLQGVTPYPSVKDLCDDPDIDFVCIASPNLFHSDYVGCALRANKSLICEKPLGLSVEECDGLIKMRNQSQSRLAVVNHQLRFNPYMRKIRDLISSGCIGRVVYCRIHQQGMGFFGAGARWTWMHDGPSGGGVRLAMGSHLVDLVRFLLGQEFNSIACSLDPVRPTLTDSEGFEREITGSGFCALRGTLASGLAVDLIANSASHGANRFDIAIYGTEGDLQFDLSGKLRLAGKKNLGTEAFMLVDGVYEDELKNKTSIFSGSFRYFASELVQSFSKEREGALADAAQFEDARATQVVLDAALQSARHGDQVQLGPTRSVATAIW